MENFFFKILEIIKQNPSFAYIFSIFNSFLQIFFPPYPGDTFIALQGYLSTLKILNSTLLLIITLLSTITSSIMLFFISYYFSEQVLKSKYINKFFNLNNISKFEIWYEKYGPLAIIISKFMPGINSIVLIASGILKLNKSMAIFSIIISCALHNSMLFLAGRITGLNIYELNLLIKEYSLILLLSITIIGLSYIIIWRLIKNIQE